ncbi:peroxiredoxin-like family protein [Derxia gummosa]|uniref:thioredoxin-dependent peroxiredoxin n=1 Tax=Derxia gummosa DSM 723 TaxID=1121388 RepID=A0A8B6X7Q4_9BURK|nr:peroxiredoxin-like family protein [Derxia gummosa]
MPESLHQIFRELHAHRERTMDPAALAININQRATLVREADPARWVKAGDVLDDFTLHEVDGEPLTADALLRHGPVVLIFFRFEGCPACNLALPYYQRNLLGPARALGATLVAVSPQLPERLGAIKRRHELGFLVASDPGNALATRLGITYEFDEPSKQASLARGAPIGEVTGTGTWELPMPTVVVIGPGRRVAFADVHPDWLLRTEAAPVIEALERLGAISQASA